MINSKANSGKGYGSKLLDKALSIAKKLQAKSLFLTVSKQVPQSLDFFLKKKFTIVNEEIHHETGDVEYTMVRKIA